MRNHGNRRTHLEKAVTQTPDKNRCKISEMSGGDNRSGGRGGQGPWDVDDLESASTGGSVDSQSARTYIVHGPPVPDLFTSAPPIRDPLETDTSILQDQTVQECLPFLAGLEGSGRSLFDHNEHGVPRLDRDKHILYLHNSLQELSAGFVAYDASRPWVVYWALTGLCLLGEDVEQYRQRFRTLGLQNPATMTSRLTLLQSCPDFLSDAKS